MLQWHPYQATAHNLHKQTHGKLCMPLYKFKYHVWVSVHVIVVAYQHKNGIFKFFTDEIRPFGAHRVVVNRRKTSQPILRVAFRQSGWSARV